MCVAVVRVCAVPICHAYEIDMVPGPGVKVQGIALQDDKARVVPVEAKPVGLCRDCRIRSRHCYGQRARQLADRQNEGRKVTGRMTLSCWQRRRTKCNRKSEIFALSK